MVWGPVMKRPSYPHTNSKMRTKHDTSKKYFLERFFPSEKMKAKVVDFFNLHQRGISFLEYSSKFTKFSMYTPSLVSDPRDEMNRFLTGVSDGLKEKCHSAMIHYNMNISCFVVHAQQVEESRVKRKRRDAKRTRSFNDGSSKGRLYIKD